MNRHIITGWWQLGLGLSLSATLLFGVLPIALKGLLSIGGLLLVVTGSMLSALGQLQYPV